MPAPPAAHGDVFYEGRKLTTGCLCVNVESCSRLIQITTVGAMVYCSLSVGKSALMYICAINDRRE